MHSRKDFGVQRRWGGAAGLQQPAELTAPHGQPAGSSSTVPRERGHSSLVPFPRVWAPHPCSWPPVSSASLIFFLLPLMAF